MKRSAPRTTVTPRHPLNIKPGGNALLLDDDTIAMGAAYRRAQLGHLSEFPDELLLSLLGYFDAADLLQLSHTSRLLYCFTYDEELWRKLYIQQALAEEQACVARGEQAPMFPLGIKHWRGTWKKTLLGFPQAHAALCTVPHNHFFSDALFRSFQCATVDYPTVLASIIAEEHQSYKAKANRYEKGRIPRVSENEVTLEAYNAKYVLEPFILTEQEGRWPAWTLASLVERFPNERFRQEAVRWPLSFYCEYFTENHDESPLYLFDCQSPAMTELVRDYTVPECFGYDLFTVFDETAKCRPDHAWLVVGPARSGSTFHKDPNHTSAWNTTLSGRKLWVMLPPDMAPPGVGTDQDESEVTSPVGIAEWFVGGFFQDALKLSNDSGACRIAVTFPGECIHVPAGWWHSVINLDDCVALTQNFVPRSGLGRVFDFLKNKSHQISGFRPAEVRATLTALVERGAPGADGFAAYLAAAAESGPVDQEDCGETLMQGKCGLMPVFEMFEELLRTTTRFEGMAEVLAEAYTVLEGLEQAELKKKVAAREVVSSKRWEALVEQPGNGFSFGFGFEED